MIKPIYLKALRNAEYLQFIEFYLKLIEENDPVKLKVEPHFLFMSNLYNEAQKLFKLPQESEITGYLLELDIDRDNSLRGIRLIVEGYTRHYQKPLADAAVALRKNMDLYGPRIPDLNYQAESQTITSIIKDWETDSKLATAVTDLGLEDWKNFLKQTNEKFIELYSKRLQESGKLAEERLFDKRTEINEAYTNMGKLLEVQAFLGNPEDYKKIFNEINALVDKTNILLDTRKTRNKDKDQGETPTEE